VRGQGAMASYPQRSREQIELDRLEFELVKRRVLLGLAVLLCLSAVASTIICALHGWGWGAAGSGLSGAVLGGLSRQRSIGARGQSCGRVAGQDAHISGRRRNGRSR
jgi:uncharacterized membrane protein